MISMGIEIDNGKRNLAAAEHCLGIGIVTQRGQLFSRAPAQGQGLLIPKLDDVDHDQGAMRNVENKSCHFNEADGVDLERRSPPRWCARSLVQTLSALTTLNPNLPSDICLTCLGLFLINS